MRQLERACETMARLINGQMFPMQYICEFAWEKHVQKPKGLESCGNDFFDMRHKVENFLNALHTLCWDIPVGTDYGLHHNPDSDVGHVSSVSSPTILSDASRKTRAASHDGNGR